MTDALVEKKVINENVVALALNRPSKRNALNINLLEELHGHLEDKNVKKYRILFLSAEGPIFSSGLDLDEATDETKIEKSAALLNKVYLSLYKRKQITVSLLQGSAFAGGLGLALATDFIIAEEHCLFGFPETKRGLIPAQILPLLTKLIAPNYVKELLLLGENISATKAKQIGLIFDVAKGQELYQSGLALSKMILKSAPIALSTTKALIQEESGDIPKNLENSLKDHVAMRKSEEAKEGFRAFIEKRPPNWESLLT